MKTTNIDPSMPTPACDKFVSRWVAFCVTQKMTFNWISELDKWFAQNGLQVHAHLRLPIRDDLAKPWTENVIAGLGDTVEYWIPSLVEDGRDSLLAQEWRGMLNDMVLECRQCASFRVDMIVVVGRKGT